MGTIVDAVTAIKARATAITMLPRRWHDEAADSDGRTELPDTPAPFVFIHIEMDRANFLEHGAGRGSNRARVPGEIQAFVFTPRDWGLEASLPYAEHVAAALRSYKVPAVSIGFAAPQPVGDATPLTPPWLSSVAGNYACSIVALPFTFIQVG
jgi:hypothetical protein